LAIDIDRKIYKSYTNPFYDYQAPENIEVVKNLGFRESERI